MQISRSNILSAIIGKSGSFPTCNLRGKGDIIFIDLFNSIGKLVYTFEAEIKGYKELREKGLKTYYKISEYLFNNPQIILTCDISTPKILKIIRV